MGPFLEILAFNGKGIIAAKAPMAREDRRSGRFRIARIGSQLLVFGLAAQIVLFLPSTARAVVSCPISYGSADSAKPNKIYLYFPTADDSSFPNYATGTSPARAFDAADLPAYTGTTAQLRGAVSDVVIDDYCEFNVQVIATTASPPTTAARRVIVAVGTDDGPGNDPTTSTACDGGPCVLFGQADDVDTGDATDVNFARVWAGSYQTRAGDAGEGLAGVNSTLARWAASIGGTTAHEAGHTYGLSHSSGLIVNTGEDALTRHLMASGSNFTDEQRAGYVRHMSDTNFSTLAANVGLSIQTMHNWDFTNPNGSAATGLRIDVLSPNSTLTLSWAYTGSSSPWTTPTVSGPSGTQVFKGTTYNRFQVTWNAGQSWSGGSSGNVPAGAQFHIGATFSGVDFNQPDPVILTKVSLLDSGGSALPLSPRMIGYDAGTLDSSDGSFDVTLFNPDPDAGDLLVRNVTVTELPRILSIDSMVRGAPLKTWQGEEIQPWKATREVAPEGAECKESEEEQSPAEVRASIRRLGCVTTIEDSVDVTVARLSQGRHVLVRVNPTTCTPPADSTRATDVNECESAGYNVDLFPSTTILITADVVQPNVRHWDASQGRFVIGPVTSELFYQVGGVHPDLNENKIDDAIDIASGTSMDKDANGVVDDAVAGGLGSWWWVLLLLILILLLLLAFIMFLRQARGQSP